MKAKLWYTEQNAIHYKNNIYKYTLHKQYKYSSSNMNYNVFIYL